MKFAFLIHPLSDETNFLMHCENGLLKPHWGLNPLGFSRAVHEALQVAGDLLDANAKEHSHVADEMLALLSRTGAVADGRLYEIPMDAAAILDDPSRAMEHMEEAVAMAAEWGAEIVGLGSMTGVIGGQGEYLAERAPTAITTGNSLTVYAALENVRHACEEFDLDLEKLSVAVIGIPGSIATAAARFLAPRCGKLLLVGRRRSARATAIAAELDAPFYVDIPTALSEADIIVTATSTGDCIDQQDLRPGSIVIDVAVPTDVRGTRAERDDVLILSGGLALVPETMPRDSKFIWFHHGMVPSCLAETMVLGLDGRKDCFSLGRNLEVDRIEEIGKRALEHGFDFSRLFSFGLPVENSVRSSFCKTVAREHLARRSRAGSGQKTNGSSAAHVSIAAPAELAKGAVERYARHVNPVLATVTAKQGLGPTFVRGEGAKLWDDRGQEYLDFVSGFGSVNLGHNHPAVAGAVCDALRHQAPGFAQSTINPYAAALAEELVAISPRGLEMVFFCNSGTEAVEAALKLARKSTGREGLLSCERSFHGKSLGSLSVTGNRNYQRPFGPLVPGCDMVRYGDLGGLERLLSTRRYAAFIVEPIQAEGGMHVPPEGYLRQAEALCREHETLLIVDEVQTGLGRTGAMFAVEQEDVCPDVMTLAKSLGGGMMPIGAMIARRDLWRKAYGTMDTFALHTSTFGGGSLACAAGLATLATLRDEHLVENAAERGRELYEGLAQMCASSTALKEVRGQGLLLGLEFEPLPAAVGTAWKAVDQSGLIEFLVPGMEDLISDIPAVFAMQVLLEGFHIYTQVARSNPRVLRVQPPLVVTSEQVQQFLSAIEKVCAEWELGTHFMTSILTKSNMGNHRASEEPGDKAVAREALG